MLDACHTFGYSPHSGNAGPNGSVSYNLDETSFQTFTDGFPSSSGDLFFGRKPGSRAVRRNPSTGEAPFGSQFRRFRNPDLDWR
jgi:hypothetical protein